MPFKLPVCLQWPLFHLAMAIFISIFILSIFSMAKFIFIFILSILQWPSLSLSLSYISCDGHLFLYLYLIYLAVAIFIFIFIWFILQWPSLYIYLILSFAAGLPLVLSIVWVSAMALKGTDQERYCFISHHLPRLFLPPLREMLKRKTCLKYLFDLKILSV